MPERIEQSIPFQPGLLSQHDRLRECLHAGPEQRVGDQLHGRSHAVRSHVERLAEQVQKKLTASIRRFVAADENDERARLRLRRAA